MEKYINFPQSEGMLQDRGYYSDNDNKPDEKTIIQTQIVQQKIQELQLKEKLQNQQKKSKEEHKEDNKKISNTQFTLQKGSVTAKQHQGDQDEAFQDDNEDNSSIPHSFASGGNKAEEEEKQFELTKTKRGSMRGFRYSKLNSAQQRVMVSENEPIAQQRQSLEQLDSHPWRHLIFGPMITQNQFKKHLILTYRGLVYAKKCLKGPSVKFIQTKQVQCKNKEIVKTYTLLMDLDETLIHSCSLKDNPDKVLWAKNEYGQESRIGIKIRPYCKEFLETMSNLWDIYIFTAASAYYAQAIINHLDPSGRLISGILSRANCMETKNGFYIKDLRILKDKDISKMILVDNLANSFGFQIENGIPILEWHSDKSDMQLKYLMDYLTACSQVSDVRKYNRTHLKLLQLADCKLEDL